MSDNVIDLQEVIKNRIIKDRENNNSKSFLTLYGRVVENKGIGNFSLWLFSTGLTPLCGYEVVFNVGTYSSFSEAIADRKRAIIKIGKMLTSSPCTPRNFIRTPLCLFGIKEVGTFVGIRHLTKLERTIVMATKINKMIEGSYNYAYYEPVTLGRILKLAFSMLKDRLKGK